jgi:hypothetical protein
MTPEEQRARFILAAATIERDVRLSDLTDEEIHRLTKALQSDGEVRAEGWRPIETAPDDRPFMVGLWVTNNKTGERWWETYIISLDDETGEAEGWPDGEPLPWVLRDFEAWRALPAPPAIRSGSGGGENG